MNPISSLKESISNFHSLTLVNKLAFLVILLLIIIDLFMFPVIVKNKTATKTKQEASAKKISPTTKPSPTASPSATIMPTKAISVVPTKIAPTSIKATNTPAPTTNAFPTLTPTPISSSGDTERPVVQITNMLDGDIIHGGIACLSLTASDNKTPVDKLLVRFKWDGGDWTGSHNVFSDCKPLHEGPRSVFVGVKDEAGNEEMQSRSFTMQPN